MEKYKPEVCVCCGQTTTYLIAIDHGTVHIVKQIARFIQQKGINCVHPRKEMEGAWLTSNEVGNLSRARLHGLIAKVKDNPGNYLLTKKGARFLKGDKIPRVAIIRKGTEATDRHNDGYFNPEEDTCVVGDFTASQGDYWEGINYTIEEGRIVRDVPEQRTLI